jgi:hypothetical protein
MAARGSGARYARLDLPQRVRERHAAARELRAAIVGGKLTRAIAAWMIMAAIGASSAEAISAIGLPPLRSSLGPAGIAPNAPCSPAS